MLLFKKLIFVPGFLISFGFLLSLLPPLLKTYDFIFSLSLNSLIPIVTLAAFLILTGVLFALFYTLCMDWKIALPVSLVASFLPAFFFEPTTAIILGIGSLIGFVLTFLSIDNSLKNYLEFQPITLLGPSIRRLSTFLIVVICTIYYLSINTIIPKEGFSIPESLIDSVLQFTMPQTEEVQPQSTPLPKISSEQIKLLKQNPQALKQFGLDPKILDNLEGEAIQPQQISQEIVKQTLNDQLNKMIEPYLNFIPVLLAIIFFFLLQTISSLMNIFGYFVIWVLFFLFEKTGFVKFVMEEKPVKKMVV